MSHRPGWSPLVLRSQIEWDTDPGVREVQSITTSTFTGPNEVQTITTSAADVDEVQVIATNASLVREVQTITTSAQSTGVLGGSFAVSLDTRSSGGTFETSGEISYAATATGGYLSMKRMLEAMKNIGEGGIYDVRGP